MRKRRITGTGAAVAVMATLLLQATGVNALESTDPDTGHDVMDARRSTVVDAGILAEQRGWDGKSTVAYVDQSRRFADLAAELGREFPKTYAGASFAERPGASSVVRFVGEPPEDAVARAEKSGLAITVLGGAKYSEVKLQDRARAVHEHLLRSGFREVATATTAGDGILATVYGDGKSELPDDLSEGVRVTRSRGPVAADEHTRGGAPLLSNGSFRCTSGFAVRASNGTTGVATAGHCTVNQYRQPSDGLTYGMTHQLQHNSLFGDYEWKTTSHIEPAEYFATTTQVREVNTVSGLLPVNTPSCVFGRSSNSRACDQVFSNFVVVTINGVTNWFLMAMDNDNTIPGDSGGPWSFSTIADGIHKGDVTLGGGRRNMWSRADLMPLALGVSVRTQ